MFASHWAVTLIFHILRRVTNFNKRDVGNWAVVFIAQLLVSDRNGS